MTWNEPHYERDEYSQESPDYGGVGLTGKKVRKGGCVRGKGAYARQKRRWRAKNRSRYNEYQRRHMAARRVAALLGAEA